MTNLFSTTTTPGRFNQITYSISDVHNKKNFFYIGRYDETSYLYPKVQAEVHSHDFYTIICFFTGDGIGIVDFNEYKIAPNTIFFLPPGQLYRYINLKDFSGIICVFSDDFLNNMSLKVRNLVKQNFFSIHGGASVCHIFPENAAFLNEDCQRMLDRMIHPKEKNIHADYMATLLSQFLFDVLENGKWVETQNYTDDSIEYQVYIEFMECVEHNFKKLHTTASYVELLSPSLSTLNKYITHVSGKTPARLINERIVLEAKRMLYERTDMRINEIAYDLGFKDNSNFVKFFKSHVGMPPIEFRKKL